MASRRNSKFGSSKKKKTNKKKQSKRKDRTFVYLPSDMLQLVFSHLSLKDNIRASAVCKTWHEACVSVRVVATTPWLIYFPEIGESYHLYDPLMQKTRVLKFPELSGYRVCCSKDGWLLMYNANTFELFFFTPFTRDRIPVPSQWMSSNQRMAFSCAPTSTSCLLFTVSRVTSTHVYIRTCSPKDKEWKAYTFRSQLPQNNHIKQIVFSNGVFYCLTNAGYLVLYNPSLKFWTVLPKRPFRSPGMKGCFMTEHQGDIFLVYMYKHMNPTVLKFDHTTSEWTEKKTLGGLTIYASVLSSESRADQQGRRNCLCFSVFTGLKRTCINHEVGKESTIRLKWRKPDTYEHIWITPPMNARDLPLFDQVFMYEF